jgi:hypothetical protein
MHARGRAVSPSLALSLVALALDPIGLFSLPLSGTARAGFRIRRGQSVSTEDIALRTFSSFLEANFELVAEASTFRSFRVGEWLFPSFALFGFLACGMFLVAAILATRWYSFARGELRLKLLNAETPKL